MKNSGTIYLRDYADGVNPNIKLEKNRLNQKGGNQSPTGEDNPDKSEPFPNNNLINNKSESANTKSFVNLKDSFKSPNKNITKIQFTQNSNLKSRRNENYNHKSDTNITEAVNESVIDKPNNILEAKKDNSDKREKPDKSFLKTLTSFWIVRWLASSDIALRIVVAVIAGIIIFGAIFSQLGILSMK